MASGRRAWRSTRDFGAAITVRGRGFLAAGAACLIGAQVVGERDLLRVGILLIALPLVSVAIVARTRYRVRATRSLSPARAEIGIPARVVLRMENISRIPSSVLLMEDTLPYALGGRPRFVLREVEPSGVREATYTVRSDSRGRFDVGPLTVRLTDPFGCAELSRSFTAVDVLTVIPKVHALPPVRLGGDWHGGGEGRAAQVAITGEADVATREYRNGDDLRKVHWRSTAKRGAIMVRPDEQPQQNAATLLLDTRRTGHRGEGPNSSFEWAVSAVASIGVWLSHQGYGLRMQTTAGLVVQAPSPAHAEGALLDALATLTPGRERHLDAGLRGLLTPGRGGLVVAVLATPDQRAIDQLARIPFSASTAVAVVVDAATFGAARDPAERRVSTATADAARALRANGWRVLVARSGDELAALWPQTGRRPVATSPLTARAAR